MNGVQGHPHVPDSDKCGVSVVIPCYNDGHYLPEAVESVLGQETPGVELEILIVDDHSSEPHTLDILSSLETAHREVKVLRNTGRSGPAAARNVGISAARGEWIAFLDSDDVWLPGSLLARWQMAENTPEAQWIGADFVYWYEDKATDQEGFLKSMPLSGPLVCAAYQSGRSLRFVRPVKEFLKCLLTWTGTVLVKKALLERVGGFDERLKGPEDFHLWVRLAQAADFYFVPMVVARYRQHEKSLMHGPGNIHFLRRRQAIRLLFRILCSNPTEGQLKETSQVIIETLPTIISTMAKSGWPFVMQRWLCSASRYGRWAGKLSCMSFLPRTGGF